MLVLSWNIKAITGAAPGRLAAIVARLASMTPDVVLLQEVANHVADPLNVKLKALGWNAFFGSVPDDKGKPYGNMIASPWPLLGVAPGWAKAPWAQLLTRAAIKIDGIDVDVIVAHMPNGSGNGWRKIDTFEALADALAMAPKMPRILGGDFNEPWKFEADGGLVSFGANRHRDGSHDFEGNRTDPKTEDGLPGVSRPRAEWDKAVQSILGWCAPHGLRHVHHVVHGFVEMPTTHVVQKKPRFFDHLLVSGDFTVEDSGFHDGWRIEGLSDHSAAWARVGLGGSGAAS